VLIALELDNYNFDLDEKSIKLKLDNYIDFAKNLGVSKAILLDTLLEIQKNINNNTYLAIESKQDTYYSSKQLKLSKTQIDIDKLEEISKKAIADNYFAIERKRKGELIDALRNYYHQNYRDSQTKLLKCDCCKEETFLTEKESSYVEFHHLIPFSMYSGPDHYLNLIGICANCHRKLHFARNAEKQNLYANISTNNQLSISLLDRMKKMLAQKALEPISIEFLKTEGMITLLEYNKFMNNDYAK
jgi:Holliday junction resolvase